jgi:WhiB family redox-sensing transcriptional regulator
MARHVETLAAQATPPVAALPDRACADTDFGIFYPDHRSQARQARDICGRCPHRQPCLDWALETRQSFGIWAGTSPDERAAMHGGDVR